jgi:3'(2'), 5'-bisphosphate nucleotidase
VQQISVTRSADDPPRALDDEALRAGYRLKTGTTSQTLDMLRTAVDLTGLTELEHPGFDLFWRREQKLWDGVAGHCLGAAAGLRGSDEQGRPLRLNQDFLSAPAPVFPSSVLGSADAVDWFLAAVRR